MSGRSAGRTALVVVAAAVFGVAGWVVVRDDRTAAGAGAQVPLPSSPPRIAAAVIGDSYFAPVAGNTSPPVEDLVGAAMGWDSSGLAVGGTGFLATGYVDGSGTTYRQRLDQLAPDHFDVVVFEGGGNDSKEHTAAESGGAAEATLRDARAREPHAKIVLIGPLWSGDYRPTSTRFEAAYRDAVQAVPGVIWIDPVPASWFPGRFFVMSGDRAGLIVADKTHPNDRGEALLKGKVVAALKAAGLPTGVV